MRCRRKREAEGKKASFAEEMRRIEAARGSKLSGESLLCVARFCDIVITHAWVVCTQTTLWHFG